MLALCALGEVAHHVGLDVGRDHLALRNRAREPDREVAGTRADVRDRHRGLERERGDHLVGLLPGITTRIVELLRPLIRMLEAMRHVVVMVV